MAFRRWVTSLMRERIIAGGDARKQVDWYNDGERR
jgi:hypothetical protein